ncbi:MAG: helix-turn-helix transcriptional regulator [Labilithrix sp.]|nr:helix-turn-helix transcriptional regulator [Labilithrix sp.]MCW5831822.1 helix-turn-helix transcriptional regulator [Labilithrix sp.]
MSFGDEVRRRREALGWTLEQLAERSKLSPNYIGTVENGRRDPSLSTVLALAKGLRVAAGELLGPVKDLSPAAYEVGRAYDASPEDVQDLVVRLLHVTSRRRR